MVREWIPMLTCYCGIATAGGKFFEYIDEYFKIYQSGAAKQARNKPDGYTDDDTILPPRLLNTAGDETKKSLRLADSHALRLREID
ncbi:hypothetical protein C5167_002179 [Papaver somniferum]|uniref:Uncharacterized protein n=1 Tax=Papaver somniferum TaxID=3469 RepID=A0A4Y7KXD5_PAPSO|nr:hypothetical protein C5167_002179 [Papaver somniferum]